MTDKTITRKKLKELGLLTDGSLPDKVYITKNNPVNDFFDGYWTATGYYESDEIYHSDSKYQGAVTNYNIAKASADRRLARYQALGSRIDELLEQQREACIKKYIEKIKLCTGLDLKPDNGVIAAIRNARIDK